MKIGRMVPPRSTLHKTRNSRIPPLPDMRGLLRVQVGTGFAGYADGTRIAWDPWIPGGSLDPWWILGSLDPHTVGRVHGISVLHSARDLPVDHGIGGLVGIVGLPSTARVLGI